MGFNSVYRSLIEIFPQIDKRLLRAVAIEQSKDADAAVESVISEIIPYWSQRSFAAFSPPKDIRSVDTSDGGVESEAEYEEQSKLLRRRTVGAEREMGTSSGVLLMNGQAYDNDGTLGAHLTGSTNDEALTTSAVEAEHEEQIKLLSRMVGGEKEVGSSSGVKSMTRQAYDSDGSIGAHLTGSTNDETLASSTTILNFYDSCYGKSSASTGGEELILLRVAQKNSDRFGSVDEPKNLTNEGGDNVTVSHELPTNLVHEMVGASDNLIDLHGELKEFEGPCADDFDMISCGKLDQAKSFLDGSSLERNSSMVEVVPSSPQEDTVDTICHSPHEDIDASASTDDFEKLEAGGSIDLKSNDEFPVVRKEDTEGDANIIITRSGQICRVDLLEEIIEVSKNHKTLFAAMESVMNMMREVELQEKAAETAEEEAARGGLDVLVEVEKLKTMLEHAKEANNMHAGEVYGEKAILATELRELQTRMLSLSDERDKSLAILDEMHQSLEARLAVAEKLKKAAEQEKLEKEESARNALAEQEAIMEMVVQDSKILEQEAEENSKLQEFLIDRGHVVDALQGEISVIFQDIRLLKENFDERVPLSKSISSSQTSCRLASSGSSVKSIALDLLSEKNGTSKSPLKEIQTPTDAQSSGSGHEEKINSMYAQSPGSRHEEEIISPDHRALLDDGWDIFDKDTELQQDNLAMYMIDGNKI
ncbi:uncharacterized protein LOC119982417 isoform X2 [Tripterygium wilfordii]|uniref:uncharacterized protein LOC119982417 isoform X2 n=1 Tax=Tripterygium wilfordii TaxID=458696 RepID=UPI0018F8110D|nr:uncharacterized protein LOC119982417 isoform X2 [Tripterygium wilfordii]